MVLVFFIFFIVSLKANIEVPFEMVNGLVIIEAEVDGETGNYIVDSGSNEILLNSSLEKRDVIFETLTGSVEGDETGINSLRVGSMEIKNLIGFSMDLSSLESVLEKEINGILGCSIFIPNTLVFDFSKKKLSITEDRVPLSIKEQYRSLSYEVINEIPVTKIELNNNKYAFILDSGASSHFVDVKLLLDAQLAFTPNGTSKKIYTAEGIPENSNLYSCRELALEDDLPFEAYTKDFSDISSSMEMPIHGLISLNKIAKDKVYFDIKSKKVFF